MKEVFACLLTLMTAFVTLCRVEDSDPLRLVKTIVRPQVQRKWDHFTADLDRNRLFVASETDPVVEVFDLRTNGLIHIISGLKRPHNILVRDDLNKIYVVDGEASEIKILQGDSYKLVGHISLTIDADPIAYDSASKYLYVVNGGREAHKSYCLVSIVDTTTARKIEDIKLDTNRLESMALEKKGRRLFVNMAGADKIAVIDRKTRSVVDTWPIKAGSVNAAMQLDEPDHRLFIVTRKPPKMVVLDTETGKEIQDVSIGAGTDDLAYDAGNRRLYAPSLEGFISVIEQRDANHYGVVAKVPTAPGAKTARLVSERGRYYVGVPTKNHQEAKLLVYEVRPRRGVEK